MPQPRRSKVQVAFARMFPADVALRAALLGAALLGTACWENGPPRPPVERRTPVVLLLVDTLRADRLGLYGHLRPTSPHLDALAAESVVFERAQSPAPWTLPTVVSAFTSTWPTEHGVLVAGQRIGPDLTPLAVRLRRLGYRTAAFVANPLAASGSGLQVGYETVVRSRAAIDREAVASWLDSVQGEPFLLYLHSTEPHLPYRAPDAAFAQLGARPPADRVALVDDLRRYRSLTRLSDRAHRGLAPEERRTRQRELLARLAPRRDALDLVYDASVAWADANIGATLELLRARDLLDRSIVVVLSDHGEEILEHGGLLHGQSLYAELVRVPFLWRLPGAFGAGTRVAEPVTLVDLLPTLLDLLGADGADDPALHGRSFADLLAGARREADGPLVTSVRVDREYAYVAGPERGDLNVAALEGAWKGIWNVEPGGFELYRMDEDPGERRNLAAQEPERARRLQSALERWLLERPLAAPSGPAEIAPEDREKLRALGYVE